MVEVLVDRMQSGPHTRSKSVKAKPVHQQLADHATKPALAVASLDVPMTECMHWQRCALVPHLTWVQLFSLTPVLLCL